MYFYQQPICLRCKRIFQLNYSTIFGSRLSVSCWNYASRIFSLKIFSSKFNTLFSTSCCILWTSYILAVFPHCDGMKATYRLCFMYSIIVASLIDLMTLFYFHIELKNNWTNLYSPQLPLPILWNVCLKRIFFQLNAILYEN